jgi:hypothetical protein
VSGRAAVIALAALAGGCALPSASERDALQDTVRMYNEDLRWSRFSDAVLCIVPARRQRFLDQARVLQEDIEFANYELLGVEPRGEGRVQVRVQFEWTSRRTGLLRKTEIIELWARQGGAWLLADSRVERGEKLPLLDRPDGDK